MPKGNSKRLKDLLEYFNKDLDALIFLVGQCSLVLVDAAKSSFQQLSYTTCVSLIIPPCQKLWDLLNVHDDDHQEICHEPPSTSSGVTVRQKLI